METPSGGILARLGEKFLGWIGLALLILIGIAIWQMDPVVRTAIWQGIWRTILWVAIAAALPWSAKLYLRRVLGAGTNWASAGLLAVLALVDLGAGLLLLSGCEATVEAKRVAVAAEVEDADDAAAQEGLALPQVPTVPTSENLTDAVREKLADVADGAADVAKSAAERLRSDGENPAEDAAASAAGNWRTAAGERVGKEPQWVVLARVPGGMGGGRHV